MTDQNEKAVSFDADKGGDIPSKVDPSISLLLGIYGTAAMFASNGRNTPLYVAGALSTATGAVTYYRNYFARQRWR